MLRYKEKRRRVHLVLRNGQFEKIPYDPQLNTTAANTIKLVRFAHCKNKNLHAALKQKFQILDSVLELSYFIIHYYAEPGKLV